MALIYKVCPRAMWDRAEAQGAFAGAPVDLADGFIHFSTRDQLAETVAKHFAGQDDLVVVGIEEADLGDALVYEPSRGGALFPHLYGVLPASAARFVRPLVRHGQGHRLPELD